MAVNCAAGAVTKFTLRIVDWKFSIAYGDDLENFKAAINHFVTEDSRKLGLKPTAILYFCFLAGAILF